MDADFDGCNSSDDTCLCNSSTFVNSVTSCIESSCSGNDLATAESDAQQLCLAVVRPLPRVREVSPVADLFSQGVTLATSASATGSSSASHSASSTSSSA